MVRIGFTLVELLVSITIIVILLALLSPSLDRAVERAIITQCAANLDAWGTGMGLYALDNRRYLMQTARHFGHVVPYPNAPYVFATVHPGD